MLLFHIFWGLINILNIGYILYSLSYKIEFYIDPDNMDYIDQRELLKLVLTQLLLWGNALLWCEPLFFFLLIIPLLYFWRAFVFDAKKYISRLEMLIIIWIIASYLLNLFVFFATGQESKTFADFARLFLFQAKSPLG